jgi:hypothetical protein
MPRFSEKHHFTSMFNTARSFTPAVVVEEVNDDGYVEEVMKPVRMESTKKYLPGERLLLKLDKERRKATRRNVSVGNTRSEETKMNQIIKGMGNVMKLL